MNLLALKALEVCWAIERCGASPELTAAVSLAAELQKELALFDKFCGEEKTPLQRLEQEFNDNLTLLQSVAADRAEIKRLRALVIEQEKPQARTGVEHVARISN